MVDSSALIAIYSGEMDLPEQNALNTEESIPTNLIALKKYAYRVKSQKQGGTALTNIKLLHHIDIQEILQETKYELRDE